MLDIRWIRENADALDAALAKRGAEPQAQSVIALDEKRRSVVQSVQDMQSRRNAASKEIGAAMAQKDSALADKLKGEVAEIKVAMPAAEAEERELTAALTDALSRLPNIPFEDVPVGKDEHDNVVTRTIGDKPRWNHAPKEHYEIGEALGYMDFERASKLSGARFTVLTGPLARLERALGQFMIDLHTGEHGYTEVSSPLMVRDEAMFGTGQLPKFADDLFKTTDGRWLIPTAEVTLTNLVAGEILEQEKLPVDAASDFFRRLYSCDTISGIRELLRVVLVNKNTANSSQKTSNIALLKSYISQHLDSENLSLKWLAENYLFVSVGYLSKQFVKEEGMRFSDYLNKERMEEAIRLMTYYHSDNIKHIARQVGFGSNPQYFSQVFKRYTGFPPTEYIEKMKENKHNVQ